MFTSSLTEEVKLLEEEIQVVMNKVDDPVMCTKIRQFVYASRDIQNIFKEDASEYIYLLLYDHNLRFEQRKVRWTLLLSS
jgi:hypothetical protein